MNNKLNCLILCGGKGSRLGLIGKKYPKSLLRFNNTTLLDKLIKKISYQNINQITLSCHYKYNHFVKYLKNKKYRTKVLCCNDGDITILERVKLHLKKTTSPLLVCYADEIANIDINKLLKHHLKSKKLLTITTYKYNSNFGFLFKKNKNYEFVEKPYVGNYNIGYYLFEPDSLEYIKKYKKIENFINALCVKKNVNEFIHKGKHITYNTFAEYDKVKNIKI